MKLFIAIQVYILITFEALVSQAAPDFINQDIQNTNHKCGIALSINNDDATPLQCQPYQQLQQFWNDFYDNHWITIPNREKFLNVDLLSYLQSRCSSIYNDIIQLKTQSKHSAKIKQIAVVGPYPTLPKPEQTFHESELRNQIVKMGSVPTQLMSDEQSHAYVLPILTIPKLEETFFKVNTSSNMGVDFKISLDYRDVEATSIFSEKAIKKLIATMLRLALERYTLQVATIILSSEVKLKHVIILNTESLWDEALVTPYTVLTEERSKEINEYYPSPEKLATWYNHFIFPEFPKSDIFKTYDGIIYLQQIEMLSRKTSIGSRRGSDDSDTQRSDTSSCMDWLDQYARNAWEYLHQSIGEPYKIKLKSEQMSRKDVTDDIIKGIEHVTMLDLTPYLSTIGLGKTVTRRGSVAYARRDSMHAGGSGSGSGESRYQPEKKRLSSITFDTSFSGSIRRASTSKRNSVSFSGTSKFVNLRRLRPPLLSVTDVNAEQQEEQTEEQQLRLMDDMGILVDDQTGDTIKDLLASFESLDSASESSIGDRVDVLSTSMNSEFPNGGSTRRASKHDSKMLRTKTSSKLKQDHNKLSPVFRRASQQTSSDASSDDSRDSSEVSTQSQSDRLMRSRKGSRTSPKLKFDNEPYGQTDSVSNASPQKPKLSTRRKTIYHGSDSTSNTYHLPSGNQGKSEKKAKLMSAIRRAKALKQQQEEEEEGQEQ